MCLIFSSRVIGPPNVGPIVVLRQLLLSAFHCLNLYSLFAVTCRARTWAVDDANKPLSLGFPLVFSARPRDYGHPRSNPLKSWGKLREQQFLDNKNSRDTPRLAKQSPRRRNVSTESVNR